MKTRHNTIIKILLSITVWIAICSNVFSKTNPIVGSWKGKFMQQFDVEIQISESGHEELSGRIKMFDAGNTIQDDSITGIEFQNNELTFLIPDKNTRFKGLVSLESQEIEGEFIFPDGSKHQLQVYFEDITTQRQKSNRITSDVLLDKKYTPAQLSEDILFLKENLSLTHPQYNLYTSDEGFEGIYQSAIINMNQELTLREFYNLTAPIVAKVGCSHTGIMPSKNYLDALHHAGNYFPLRLFFSDNRAWVVSGTQENELIAPGSEIKRINHLPVENIIVRLISFIPSEGFNKTSKYHELNNRFEEYYIYINDSESFQVAYIEPGENRVSTSTIDAVPYEKIFRPDEKGSGPLPIHFSVNGSKNMATLRIRSFDIRDFDTYVNLIDSVFINLKKQGIGNLVIDLRDNSGGHPIFAAILYSYLTQEEFTYFKENQDVPDFEPLYNPMQGNKNSFDGNCYVLINGGCLSTTGHLISLLKYHKRAVFIGEEPGSWFYCNDFSKQVKLPNTQIEVNIPQSTFQTAVSGYEMRDLFPIDHSVELTVDDMINNKDVYMEFTMNILQ